jgi:nicotinamide-nucleotide amidase
VQKGPKSVAILATGDELVQGDIANAHGIFMAQALAAAAIPPGQQLVVGDDEKAIVSAIAYLAESHDAIIITGGLGPTSDDLTRFAVAEWAQGELDFREHLWQQIKRRFLDRNIEVTDNNRQQCLFLPDAIIIENNLGSAHGCYLHYQDTLIVMLPGPPHECHPMFTESVLPLLLQNNFSTAHHLQRWMLLGVSESRVAQDVEKSLAGSEVKVGYRAAYPYLEVKFKAAEFSDVKEVSQRFLVSYKSNIVSNSNETALQLLQKEIENGLRICIDDQVTRGLFQHCLSQTGGSGKVSFDGGSAEPFDVVVSISGMKIYWNNPDAISDEWRLVFSQPVPGDMCFPIKLMGSRSLRYVVEYTCWELLRIMREDGD